MKFRKLTAVFLACTMLISLVPSNGVLAAESVEMEETVDEEKEVETETAESDESDIAELELSDENETINDILGEEIIDEVTMEVTDEADESNDKTAILTENENYLEEEEVSEEEVEVVETIQSEEAEIEPLISPGNTVYYVDSDDGSDSNLGTSPNQAWKTLDKVNAMTFMAGDTILFERGDEWFGQLSPKGSGSAEAPITIGAYGSGNSRPQINGNSWCGDDGDDLENRIFNAAVFFYNQEYWEITSLEITNYDPNDDESHIRKYGILIMGEDAGTLHHMYCQNLYVHDVVCIPIGSQAGIGRGGIIYVIRGNETETRWDDILIEENYLEDINHYGINLISTWGSSSFPDESGIPSSESTYRVNSTDIVIRGNYCYNIGNAAICPSAYDEALIEYNVCNTCNSGPNGNVPVWWENGNKTVVQYNEVFNSGASDSKEDSQAFDADVNATLNYIQYNYTHDNPSGAFFECALGTSYTTYIRYNISVNDGYGSNIYGGGAVFTLQAPVSGSKMYAYNNLIYMDSEHDGYITSNWDSTVATASNYKFWNNVFITNGNKGWSSNFKGTVKNNAYGGTNSAIVRADDSNAITVTAEDFVGLGTGTAASYENGEIQFGNVDGYRISNTSACIDAGTKVVDNGGKDYFGTFVEELVRPNIGADNRYNNAAEEESGVDELIIKFDDCEEGPLTDIYSYCNFGNRGWNTSAINGNKKLWATTYTSDAQTNKIAIPDGFALSSFQAVCTNGTAKITVDAGSESKTFNISEAEKVCVTNFQKAEAAVYFVIEASGNISDVKFDNILLERKIHSDSANVSIGKNATASSYERDPANAVDGDEGTLWVADGYTETTGAWWKVDLGSAYQLSGFEIVFEKEEINGWKYKVEGSSDNDSWDLLWNQMENTDGSMRHATEVASNYSENAYRYLRVTITGLPNDSMWPAIAEFNAYKVIPTTNVSLNQTATASSIEGDWRSASNGNDGDESTLWVADGYTETTGAWWKVQLDQAYIISRLEVVFEKDETNSWKYKVEGSSDNNTWDLLWDQTENTNGNKKQSTSLPNNLVGNAYQYLKVTITGLPSNTMWPAIAEFNVYACDDEDDSADEIVLTEPGQYIDLDLAFSQPVAASSEYVSDSADHVTDRDTLTTWKPNTSSETAFLQIDFDREYNIESCKVDFKTGHKAYKVEANGNAGWTQLKSVSLDESLAEVSCEISQITGIRFVFENPTDELEVSEVHINGVDANISHGKRILVMAPHEDDEMLMAGGVMKRAIEAGDTVDVVVATNGDYSGGTSKGETRINDTVNALEKIGVTKDHIHFLGYADTAGLGVGAYTTAFTNSFLYKLYVANDDTILESAQGNTKTYGNSAVKMDYHYEITGEHADYTRSNFINDLQMLVETCNPTDIYVTSRYDMHFDHAYFGMFATEVIQNIQKEDEEFNPTVHEAIIHTHLTDEVYPSDANMFGYGHENETSLTAWYYPEGLEEKTILSWGDRENVLVPYSMRQAPYKYNLKDQALRLYTTEYYSWIASFAKVNEVFWKHDFSSISHLAQVTASSENDNTDRSIDQSCEKAVDGIADGYAIGLAENHIRFPHAEWVTDNEGVGAWLNLDFSSDKVISKIVLYDRPNVNDRITAAHLEFDDGTKINVGQLPNDGRPLEVQVNNITSGSVKLVVDGVSSTTEAIGLAEIEVYGE